MFKELFELVRASGPLTMAVSADATRGTMTVVVIPKPAHTREDSKDEPALATPLSLTATPEEFDAEFTTVLAGYRTQRLSLAEQVAATNEVLAAAREASVQRGSKAATTAMARTPLKHVAAPVAAPGAAAAGEDPDDDDSDAAPAPVTGAGAVTAATSESARAGAPDLFG